ncbi:DUF1376 domain-containing protein [Dyadobacter psychrotolerans]|uniref:DUF1376 domain-containing protein n=1 Tax=Dyadobacter psychrotolerans TaxID=2541721 RepID=A0A4R5E177_9BACT|nr:DUF1376 domain-containing protein [Dyadobacter psychrotolerans]TDE17685.1 DUF1376 domain-containing protein [Dyadobacter psychrotolerans]
MTQAWYPFYWSDYSGKTFNLTMAQHGAYMLLLRHIYTTEQQIPVKQCYSIARALSDQDQSDVDVVLHQFFKLKNGFWVSEKTIEVINQTNERHEKRVNAGKKGGESKSSNARAMPKQSPSKALVTTTTTITTISSNEDIFSQAWAIYPKLRAGSRGNALKAWKAAVERGNSEELILAGVKKYSVSREGNSQYAKGFPAWMNDDRFLNDYEALENGNNTQNNTGQIAVRNGIPTGEQTGNGFGGRKSQTELYADATEKIIAERRARWEANGGKNPDKGLLAEPGTTNPAIATDIRDVKEIR